MTLPTTVCGYEILAELGRGATGIVYQARHPVVRPDRLVALKMPSLGSAMEAAGGLASFHNEWNALRILTWTPDPVIPTLLNVGSDLAGRNHHYVRDFVDGSTLEQLVANRALGLREAIHILSVIASAVQRMHGLKIAHRNLRPDRILVRSDGVPKLIGFGHVWPLAGDERVPPGVSGVSAEVDVRALQETLAWLYGRFDQSIPTALEAYRQQGSALSAGRFAEALSSYLKAE